MSGTKKLTNWQTGRQKGRKNMLLANRPRGQTDKKKEELGNRQTWCTIGRTLKLQIWRLSFGWRPWRPKTCPDHDVTVRKITKPTWNAFLWYICTDWSAFLIYFLISKLRFVLNESQMQRYAGITRAVTPNRALKLNCILHGWNMITKSTLTDKVKTITVLRLANIMNDKMCALWGTRTMMVYRSRIGAAVCAARHTSTRTDATLHPSIWQRHIL